jgi:hypothetical protein
MHGEPSKGPFLHDLLTCNVDTMLTQRLQNKRGKYVNPRCPCWFPVIAIAFWSTDKRSVELLTATKEERQSSRQDSAARAPG